MSRRLRIISGSSFAGGNGADVADADAGPTEAEVATAEARGYARGLEAGRLTAEKAFKQMVDRMASTLASLQSELERVRDEAELQAVEAALRSGVEIARRILEREVENDPRIALQTVEAALIRLPGAGEIEVRVHPADLDTLRDSGFLRDAMEGGAVKFAADASVDRGGCVVHSDAGLLDARLRTQLKHATEYLFDTVSED